MEYYSAIEKNTFESVLMRWMKLEPIIQSEVSHKISCMKRDEAQAGIKIAKRNINNLRYADDTTLMTGQAGTGSRLQPQTRGTPATPGPNPDWIDHQQGCL